MTYDSSAQKLAAKVIGTIESTLHYDAINYVDPITVGVAQWFGTRAANILDRMKATSSWSGVLPSLDNQLSSIPPTDLFWTTRHLTAGEGASLVPVLTACAAIQVDQLIKDLDEYKAVAVGQGMNPDTNTQSLIFFFAMYHQRPASALDVLHAVGASADLSTFHSGALADPVFSGYPSRYNDAQSLILAGDYSGIGVADPTPANPVVGVGNGGANFTGNLVYLEKVGSSIHLHYRDGQIIQAYPDGRGRFLPAAGATDQPTAPTTTPPPTTGAPGDWVSPMPDGTMTSPFGPRDASIGGGVTGAFHYGMDLASPAGGPPATIFAPCDLVVTIAADNLNATTGTCLKGHTPDGLFSFGFYHMQFASLVVGVGQTVLKGQKIGIEGATGNVTGRHCHIELYNGNIANPWAPPYGNPIDPQPVFAAHGVIFT